MVVFECHPFKTLLIELLKSEKVIKVAASMD